jgi:hypothetical protein
MSRINREMFVIDLGPSPEEIRYQKVLRLIVVEFKSDPMSVQCFDARIVQAAIKLVDEYELRHARYFRKYGRSDEAAVTVEGLS